MAWTALQPGPRFRYTLGTVQREFISRSKLKHALVTRTTTLKALEPPARAASSLRGNPRVASTQRSPMPNVSRVYAATEQGTQPTSSSGDPASPSPPATGSPPRRVRRKAAAGGARKQRGRVGTRVQTDPGKDPEAARLARLARMKRVAQKKSEETHTQVRRKQMLSGAMGYVGGVGDGGALRGDLRAYESELAAMDAQGQQGSAAARALLGEVEQRFQEEAQARFWEEEAKNNPLRAVPYAGRSADAIEMEELEKQQEMELKGWDGQNMDYEFAIEKFRAKFSARRQTGMLKVREKYQEMRMKANEDGDELVYTKRAEASDSGSWGSGEGDFLTNPAAEMSLNTSVDPEKVAPGEYIVHKKYGVGQFLGMKQMPQENGPDIMYMFLKYADGTAKLKASLATRLLYRYRTPGSGEDGSVRGKGPKLSNLYNTEQWRKRCERGRKSIRSLVMSVMEVYMERMQQSRPSYPAISDESMQVFEELFPYKLTPDQALAIDECQADLSLDTPMDRLVIGDVGFGKTEVAMRVIFRAVQAGAQAFVLCPTTLLAKQHAQLIAKRLAPFGHSVQLLNRYNSSKERATTLAAIADGSLNVCVGTQSLLGSEVDYSNVSLLIIDEEQRFGVAQKESIKGLKSKVDVLTMSATPIPRTMHMAVAGFRDTSLITTPPPERRPIKTHVSVSNKDLIKEVVERELARQGQVFYIVPRVSMIAEAKETLQELLPDIRVMSAHGRLTGQQQEDVMETFAAGDCDVLVCTTIVEAGLDLPRVNTIVIDNVQMFGLATLYQLRGRVGRSDKEAYAYMLWPKQAKLSAEAQERLLAIQECCQLGDGFKLAERDMAIRGVGTIFGLKQSGDVDNVGMDLYLEMLHEELQKVEKQRLPSLKVEDVELMIAADALVPESYIALPEVRARVEQAICDAACGGTEHTARLSAQLEADYGPLPDQIRIKMQMENMRKLASELGVHQVQIVRDMAPYALFNTDLAEETFDMIRDVVPSDVADALEYTPGVIRARLPLGMDEHRLSERTWSILSEMRKSLPVFVKYM